MAKRLNPVSIINSTGVSKPTLTSTPQSQPIAGRESEMIPNQAGGYTFKADELMQARRYLVLGSPSTYYASEQKATLKNAQNLLNIINSGKGFELVKLIESLNVSSVSTNEDGEEVFSNAVVARKNISIFALALCKVFGDKNTREEVYNVIRRRNVISTLRQLYDFLNNIYDLTNERQKDNKAMGTGWGSGFKKALHDWFVGYGRHGGDRWLAMQFAKYRAGTYKSEGEIENPYINRIYASRIQKKTVKEHRITARDILRQAHIKPENETQNAMFSWVTKRDNMNYEQAVNVLTEKTNSEFRDNNAGAALSYLLAFEEAQHTDDVNQVISLIHNQGLTWEMIPNTWFSETRNGVDNTKNRAEIWRALIGLPAGKTSPATYPDGNVRYKMGLTALIRNLPRLSEYGVIKELGTTDVVDLVINSFSQENLIKARVHPVRLLSALRGYGKGFTQDGRGQVRFRFKPNNAIMDALEKAFYDSFGTVQGTGKSMGLFIDVSSSMMSGEIAGLPDVTPREAAAIMALATIHSEKHYTVKGFSANGSYWSGGTILKDIPIRKSHSIKQVSDIMSAMGFGGTDCSLPFVWALEEKAMIDCFVIYTDNESWAGRSHPVEALAKYRKQVNPDARVVFVSFTATDATLIDPKDNKALDIVGFGADGPQVISSFAKGEI